MYQDKQRSYWLDILDNAVAALDNEITTRVQSPNQRRAVLAASEYLYRIAESDDKSIGIQHAQSIPDLRNPQWRKWGDPKTIRNAANYARELCRQAECQTGVFVGRDLEAREYKIAARLMKEMI